MLNRVVFSFGNRLWRVLSILFIIIIAFGHIACGIVGSSRTVRGIRVAPLCGSFRHWYIQVTFARFVMWNILSRVTYGSHVPFCERISNFQFGWKACIVWFCLVSSESREARTLGDEFRYVVYMAYCVNAGGLWKYIREYKMAGSASLFL